MRWSQAGGPLRLLPLLLLALGCGEERRPAELPTAQVTRQEVALTASADGVVEPTRIVEVKSKASGEIIAMEVDTGERVSEGQILLQLLPRDAQNLYDQAEAELEAARAREANARLELERARQLFADGLIAESELDAARLAATDARSLVVRTEKSLENAAERLAETTVRSPISGTVIAKSVEIGQVVSSAVSQVTGGTLLLTLADLDQVQVRSLVDEVDIGKVRTGLQVRIQVEAYPERSFRGQVVKIEPQAVVEQNVTMFPVLTRIDNREGLLKPGMNAEVEILIDRREGVVAVPNEAVKRQSEALAVADLMGLELTGGTGGPESTEDRPGASGAAGGGRRGGRDAREGERWVVLVAEGDGYRMQPVETGLRNWQVTEIAAGVEPGARVALLPSSAQLLRSEEFRDRIRRVRAMPGMSSQRSQRGGS